MTTPARRGGLEIFKLNGPFASTLRLVAIALAVLWQSIKARVGIFSAEVIEALEKDSIAHVKRFEETGQIYVGKVSPFFVT